MLGVSLYQFLVATLLSWSFSSWAMTVPSVSSRMVPRLTGGLFVVRVHGDCALAMAAHHSTAADGSIRKSFISLLFCLVQGRLGGTASNVNARDRFSFRTFKCLSGPRAARYCRKD